MDQQGQVVRSFRRQPWRTAGQAGTEMVVVLILVALTVLLLVRFYGSQVGGAFLCAARAIANGESIAEACGGEGGDQNAPLETVLGDEDPPFAGDASSEGGSQGAADGEDDETSGVGPFDVGSDDGSTGSGGGDGAAEGDASGPVAADPGTGLPPLPAPIGGSPGGGSEVGGEGGSEEAAIEDLGFGDGLAALPGFGEEEASTSGGSGQGGGSGAALPEPLAAASGSGVPAPAGGGAGGGTGGTAADRLREARALLESTTTGKELLRFLDEKGIPIELRSGDGSFFQDGKIFLDDSKTAEGMALTIAHEGTHGRFDQEGKSADIDKDTRDEFVRKMIEEEAVATVASIETKRDLQATGKTITATYPLEAEYNAAYAKAVEDLKKSNPAATTAEIDAAGRAAGLEAVRKGFETGKVVTSNTRETYPEYYGNMYDRHHATATGAAPAAKPEPVAAPPFGPKSEAERQQLGMFLAEDGLSEARDLMLKKEPGSSARIPTALIGNAVIVLKGADGSSTKQFTVEYGVKVVKRPPCGPGEIFACGTQEYRDQNDFVLKEIPAGSKLDPKAPRVVIDGRMSGGDIALALYRENARLARERDDPKNLENSVKRTFEDNGALSLDERIARRDVGKARAAFVKNMVEAVADRNSAQIEEKKRLQGLGASVSTPLPLEEAYDAAYYKVLAEEIGKRGPAGAKGAVDAARDAGRRALREVVESGKIVTHTGEKYADHFGKAFDQKFAEQPAALVKKKEEDDAELARQAKLEAGRKALVHLINTVDPRSPAADQVIQLVNAFAVQDRGFRLTDDARKGLVGLLAPYGFKDIDEVGSLRNEQARLDYALANFAALNERQREQLRTGRVAPSAFGIKTTITYEEMQAREEQKVPYNMGDGTSIMITRREAREAQERAVIRHALQQLQSIRTAGPGALVGRIVGCAREGVAMGPCGEKEAEIGGAVDTALTIIAPVKARANVQTNIRNMPSGGHVVTGPRSGAEQSMVPVNVRNAPVRRGAEDAPRPPQPAPRGRPLDATQPQVAFDKTLPQPAPRGRPLDPTQPKAAFDKTDPAAPPKAGSSANQPPRPPGPPNPPPGTGTGGGPGTGRSESDSRRQADARADQAARKAEAERLANLRFPPSRRVDDKGVPIDGRNVSVDEALNRFAKGENIVITENSKFHQQVFNDLKGVGPKTPKSQQPEAPPAFTVGTGARLDISDPRVTKAQRDRAISLIRAREGSGGGSASGSAVGGTGVKTKVGPAPGPQPKGGSSTDVRTKPGPGTQPQQPKPPPDGGNRTERQTARSQQADRTGQQTGEITKPGAAQERGGKVDPGGRPGKFGADDVAFGISRPDGKTDALARFAGQAKDGGKIVISEKVRNPAPGTPKDVVNGAIAKETVAEAKVFLRASGGNLRFSLEGFDVKQALKPGSPNFDAVTAHEFRQVLKDPFLRKRVRFYDGKGKDVTDEILTLPVP